MSSPRISLEFFPPAAGKPEERFWTAYRALQTLEPDFCSLTYGAGGSSHERNDVLLRRLLAAGGPPPAAHLTCVGQSRAEVDAIARRWWELGVRRIVALRGDMPEPGRPYRPHPEGYRYAADLVAGLKRVADFRIAVGAYPEVHPEAVSAEADLDHLKRKIDAGADLAITQFFFDAEVFLRFRERAEKAGIGVPLVPGILPIVDFKALLRFSKRCGAKVPTWLLHQFEGLDPSLQPLVAAGQVSDLCTRLRGEGVERFHFYTLNQAPLTLAACRRLGIRPPIRKAA